MSHTRSHSRTRISDPDLASCGAGGAAPGPDCFRGLARGMIWGEPLSHECTVVRGFPRRPHRSQPCTALHCSAVEVSFRRRAGETRTAPLRGAALHGSTAQPRPVIRPLANRRRLTTPARRNSIDPITRSTSNVKRRTTADDAVPSHPTAPWVLRILPDSDCGVQSCFRRILGNNSWKLGPEQDHSYHWSARPRLLQAGTCSTALSSTRCQCSALHTADGNVRPLDASASCRILP